MSATSEKPHLILPTGEKIELSGSVTIGRAEKCSIRLEGPKVSRDHTHIYEIGGEYQVVDSQSRNGTYLNGVRLNRPATLKAGDKLMVGGHVLHFYGEGAGPARSAASNVEMTIDTLDQIPTWLLLLDIKDSTGLTLRLGPEAYAAMVGNWFNRCRQVIEQKEGIINKSTGDGLLAYWKDPEGERGELLAQALALLRDLQKDQAPDFRMVVHHGRVGFGGAASLGEEPMSGPEVHLVFRAEKAFGEKNCPLGATAQASRLLKSWLPARTIGPAVLKGFEGEHELFSLGEP